MEHQTKRYRTVRGSGGQLSTTYLIQFWRTLFLRISHLIGQPYKRFFQKIVLNTLQMEIFDRCYCQCLRETTLVDH